MRPARPPCRSRRSHASSSENASFHYDGAVEAPALDGVSLTIEPGQRVAILGATGSGKTSLVNLIPRFYDVTAGRALVDGADVRGCGTTRCWRAGMAPQETVLFSGTVRDNIRYGRPAPATRR